MEGVMASSCYDSFANSRIKTINKNKKMFDFKYLYVKLSFTADNWSGGLYKRHF